MTTRTWAPTILLIVTLLSIAPAASGSDGIIAFHRHSAGSPGDIYLVNSDGTLELQLTSSPADEFDPAFSPDGSKIAFVSDADGDPEIFVMNADGSSPVQLTHDTITNLGPEWSPDGAEIAFTSFPTFPPGPFPNASIEAIAPDGSNRRRIGPYVVGHEGYLSWSPDGSTILFHSHSFGFDGEVAAIGADGSNPHALTRLRADDDQGRYSPDGSTIVFVSTRRGANSLFLMNSDGSNQRLLLEGSVVGERAINFPAWSPSGGSLAFLSEDFPQRLYRVESDGSNTRLLAEAPRSHFSQVSWGPGRIALTVRIDIKPGSEPNSINPRSKGVIPVAILTTPALDAWEIDATTLAFGPNGAPIAHSTPHAEDVDADGDLDMVVHFRTQLTGIACGQTEASLTGETHSGLPVVGTDQIRTVGCK